MDIKVGPRPRTLSEMMPDSPAQAKKSRTRKKDLIAPAFMPPGTWLVPLETDSAANARGRKKAIGRSGHQQDAIFLALGKNHEAIAAFADQGLHRGNAITVKVTRLGGRALDRHDNLPMAMKCAVDAIARMLGIKDNNPLVTWLYDQQPCERIGVKVEMSK